MRKLLFLFVAGLLLMSVGVRAAHVATGDYREVFMKVNSNLDEDQLLDAGVIVTARYNGFVTAMVKNSVSNNAIKTLNGVEHVASAIQLMTCVDSARRYENNFTAFGGDGV